MENLKRPTGEETDEDLIKQQELFLKNKNKPNINVARSYRQDNSPLEQAAQDFISKEEEKIVIQQKDVVFDVMERDVSELKSFIFEAPVTSSISIDDIADEKMKESQFKTKRSQSIFAQQLQKKNEESKKSNKLQDSSYSLVDGSGLLSAQPEVEIESIHKENLAKISSMSQEEILHHQNQIKKHLDSSYSLVDGSGLLSAQPEVEIESIHKENLAKISSMSQEEILYHQNQIKKHLNPNIMRFIQNKRSNQNTANSVGTRNKKTVNSLLTNLVVDSGIEDDQLSGEILRKEGKSECDALILQKVKEIETDDGPEDLHVPAKQVKSKDIEIPKGTKKLLEDSNKGLWRNMNKIEKEKLEWMSDLPKPNPVDKKTGFTARFDFEGKLLAHDIETPTYKGLHHHGNEPEVAGYSLEELFLLARSTMQSQRITALHTIAHILDNYWYGMMDNCFDNPLLHSILEAGIVPLLRWALDDKSVTSIAATVTAIHSLLICKSDEICLKRSFCWLNGHLMPQLEPQGLAEPNILIEELTDADLIKLDVIKAFLRMDILPRFYYILQIMQPPPLVCKLIIEICAHLAQHSYESAKQVLNYPELFNLLLEKFLPLKWQFVNSSKLTDTVNFCYPIPSVMKLIRIIASSSQEFAVYLVEKHDLILNIMVYLTLQPNDGKVTLQEIQELMIETLKTFHVLLSYNLAYDVFLELFPVFLKQMEFCLSLDLNSERTKHMQDFEYASHLFKVLEAVAVASSNHDSDSSYAAMNAIFNRSLVCLKKWLWQFPQDRYNDHGMVLLSSSMNFISTCYEKSHDELVCKVWKPCSETKEVFNSYLLPCIKSKTFKKLLENVKPCSLFLNSNQLDNKRDSKTIMSLGSILWNQDIVPVLKEDSPIPLLLALLRLCILQKQHFSDMNNQVLEELLLDKNVSEYLQSIATEKLNASNWFSKYERHLIVQILKLMSLVTPRENFVLCKAAISILPTFRNPEECLVEDLFETIIFNPVFMTSSKKEITHDVLHRLPVIAKSYTSCLFNSDALLHSKNILSGNGDVVSVASLCSTPFLLSLDWCYKPIAEHYFNCTQRKPISDFSLQLTSSLQWIQICHEFHLPALRDIPGAVDFFYLCLVFLLDEDYFRDPLVQVLLKDSLLSLLKYKSICLEKVDWPNVKPFDDIYLEMLNQFESVSYGDQLFGNFILFPLQQHYASRWKKLLLTDHCQVVQFLRVPISKLLIPLQNYLDPVETEFEIIWEYCKILLSGTLNPIRCPVLYLVAVHHIHHFLFARKNELENFQRKILSVILKTKNKTTQQQILLYSGVNINLDCGFYTKEKLSDCDCQHLSDIIGHPIDL